MPRLTPQDFRTLIKVFEAVGFSVTGEQSSHLKMTRKGTARPLIIPKYPDIGLDIITGLLRTAELSRDDYFKILGS